MRGGRVVPGRIGRSLVLLAVLVATAGTAPVACRAQAPSGALPYEPAAVASPSCVTGRVVFRDAPLPPRELPVTSDFGCCDRQKKWAEDLIVGENGGLANTVVSLPAVRRGKPFPQIRTVVDQQGCVFAPHLVIGFCGASTRFLNSDPVFHNVHGYTVKGWYSIFNFGMPHKDYMVDRKLTIPGPVVLKCDAGHRWMTGYIYAADNPYVTLTRGDGRFAIDGVPQGRQTLLFWHERLGEIRQSIEVPAASTLEIDVDARLGVSPRLKIVSVRPSRPARPIPPELAPPAVYPTVANVPTGPVSAGVPVSPASGEAAVPSTSPYRVESPPPPTEPTDEEPAPPAFRSTLIVVTAGLLLVLVVLCAIRSRRGGAGPQ